MGNFRLGSFGAICLGWLLVGGWGLGPKAAAAVPFVVVNGKAPLPSIVVQYDAERKQGIDWPAALAQSGDDWAEISPVRDAILFLQEGLEKITSKKLEIVNGNDVSKGIVITTLGAAPDLAQDAEIATALRNDGKDGYNDREAYFIRSEAKRLLIVANTRDGLTAAMPALLEAIGYEVLGMGPNWVHVPNEGKPADSFAIAIQQAGRPSYFLRQLQATSGQQYGVGTCYNLPLSDPADETVDKSYKRWMIGTRMHSASMPRFPGHALQAYHKTVIARVLETGDTSGFLAPTRLGLLAERPAAAIANAGHLWIDSDPTGTSGYRRVWLSDGNKWNEVSLEELGVNLDLSEPFVRQIILADLKRTSELGFVANPDRVFVFATDPEDGGGYAVLETLVKHKNWYPEYLAEKKIPFGQPFVLHGHLGLNQPKEIWDANSPSDFAFGFNNWLLREYDQWIDSRPPAEQVTATGRSKKQLLRCSLYSYNYHDVPPNFNLDPRIRVMIASYPKHRGRDKWKTYPSQQDMALAFQKLLPREPSGDYRILSLAYHLDPGVDNIPILWSASAATIQRDLSETYRAGIKAFTCETDFNFGKFGLGYYLHTKMLWNANLSAAELEEIRNQWLRRSFGSAWPEMKAYYDFLLTDNYPVNGPNSWAHAVRLIEAADNRLDSQAEPVAKRRLDDLKQMWYYYYLIDTGHQRADSPLFREFCWKGQMSYMVAQHVVTRRTFQTDSLLTAVGPELAKGPAHYTPAETAAWWAQVLAHWPKTEVTLFTEGQLVDGTPTKQVDLNDLVRIEQFQEDNTVQPFFYNSGYQKSIPFVSVATRAGQELGFQLSWPIDPTGKDGYYIPRDVPYGMDVWNTVTKRWESIVDKSLTVQPSRVMEKAFDGSTRHIAEIKVPAPRAGTYRFDFGRGGNASYLTGLDFDLATGKPKPNALRTGFTCFTSAEGHTQSGVFIYIPKGTKTLDLEVWDGAGRKTVKLFQGLLTSNPVPPSRMVDVGARKTHRVALQAGEDGTIAQIDGDGFAFPYLYSVPLYWAKSPRDLLVPRAIAKADGLTVAK